MTVADELYEFSKKKAKACVWVLSDLQQSKFDFMKECLELCMDDYESLNNPAEAIWYLGDAIEGIDPKNIEKMVRTQEGAFERLSIPVTYVMGNHDFDFALKSIQNKTYEKLYLPFYEMIKSHESWHASKSPSDPFFSYDFHNFKMYCFQDHISENLKWLSTHNMIRLGHEFYPYNQSYFDNLRSEIASCQKPVITIGHTCFPGGNRDYEAQVTSMLMPLPYNVRLHLYGHSHIGEYMWPKEKAYSQISWVNWQDIPQIDVASFENIRGCYCHSVLLHIYEDNSFGLFFRNHDKHRFESAYFPSLEKAEKPGDYETHVPAVMQRWEEMRKKES